MLRALAKTAIAWPVGHLPHGPRVYHAVTCRWLGSQSYHPPKLAAAWPHYASILHNTCQLELADLPIWVHDAGWTPISALATFLLTGRAAQLTNRHAMVLDQYLPLSVEWALAMSLPEAGIAPQIWQKRRRYLEEMAGSNRRVHAIVRALGGQVHDRVTGTIPLPSSSVAVCHSGNALEHYTITALRDFLAQCWRILRPGGIASHVFDHRDHLHHVDRHWPFLAHLAWPDLVYRLAFGHPLLFHNRLSPTDVMSLFEQIGFERVMVRRAGLSLRYASDDEVAGEASGLPRWNWGHSRRLSQLDQRTTYAHYVYRKPTAVGRQ